MGVTINKKSTTTEPPPYLPPLSDENAPCNKIKVKCCEPLVQFQSKFTKDFTMFPSTETVLLH